MVFIGVTLLFSLLAFIVFFYLLGVLAPDTLLQLRRNLKRNRYFRYARKYGFQAANKHIQLDPWVLDPWEQHLFEAALPPTKEQFMAYAWYHDLKISLGLLPCLNANLNRWHYLKTAVKGFLFDYGLLTVKHPTAVHANV